MKTNELPYFSESLNKAKEQIIEKGIDLKAISNLFSNKEKAIEYLETLWILRELLYCDIPNIDDPKYKILELTNEIIGALLKEPNKIYINRTISIINI